MKSKEDILKLNLSRLWDTICHKLTSKYLQQTQYNYTSYMPPWRGEPGDEATSYTVCYIILDFHFQQLPEFWVVQLNSSELFAGQWPLMEHGKRKGPQLMNSELPHNYILHHELIFTSSILADPSSSNLIVIVTVCTVLLFSTIAVIVLVICIIRRCRKKTSHKTMKRLVWFCCDGQPAVI